MPWSFVNQVTNELSRGLLDEQKAPTLWPSAATAIVNDKVVGKCRRQSYYRYANDSYNFSEKYDYLEELVLELKEKKIPISQYTKWIFRAGELYEDYCIELAKQAGVFVGTQISIYIPKFNVSGKIDLVVLNPEDSTYQVIEVKSIYGFNSTNVIGTDTMHKKNEMGTPRESHLMQLGIYQSWYANPKGWGPGILLYGARDTGRFAEFLVTVETDEEDGLDYIYYQGNYPVQTKKINSGITMQSIMKNYAYIMECLEEDKIPDRDYYLSYTEEMIDALYEAGELNKTDTAQYEKRKKQLEEGKSRVVKPVEKGDWQCRLCEYKNICYGEELLH